MHVSVCLSAPEREEWESAMEEAVGTLAPDSKLCLPGAGQVDAVAGCACPP